MYKPPVSERTSILEETRMSIEHCCEKMAYFVNQRCEVHDNAFACPDMILLYDKKFDEYGIIIHDGGESFISIDYCPWCGKKLPASKRNL